MMGTCFGLLLLGIFALVLINIFRSAALETRKEERKEAKRRVFEEFRAFAGKMLGRDPLVVEPVLMSRGGFGPDVNSFYAAIDDALYFGAPLHSLWKRKQIRGTRMYSSYVDEREEYVVEVRFHDIEHPLEKLSFVYEWQAGLFFERIGLVGDLR